MERKVKYSYEFKLQCVNEILKEGRPLVRVRDDRHLPDSLLRKWVSSYKNHGETSLVPKGKSARYEVDFKIKSVLEVKERCLSLTAVCSKYNIPAISSLMSWIKKYEQYGSAGLYRETSRNFEEMQFKRAKKKSRVPLSKQEDLLKENEALRCEIAFLKKFNALIQDKKIQQQKRRRS